MPAPTSFLSRIGTSLGSLLGFGGSRADAVPQDPTDPIAPAIISSVLGPPLKPPNLSRDQIVSDIVMLPYHGPLDFGNYGGETWEMRQQYRYQFRANPVVRAAMLGKIAAVSCLDPNILPESEDAWKGDPERKALAQEIAEFVNYTIMSSPGGWLKLIEDLYSAAVVDGYSVCAKKLKPGVYWRGRQLWGFDHTRQLDTNWIRIQTDVYRNPVSIVNMRRGLEYFRADEVILYTHNGSYCNPFGQSDGRSVVEAGNMIQDAYAAWIIAVKVYGLPYMMGKYGDATRKQAIATALQGLRAGGWAVTHKDDDIATIDLAAAAGTTMFGDFIDKRREDVFLGVRGSAQVQTEGDGGGNAHGDTKEQRKDQDKQVQRDKMRVANCLQHQLFRWIVEPNWGADAPIPILSLGGIDWESTKKTADTLTVIKEKLGYNAPLDYVQKVLAIPFEEQGEIDPTKDEKANTAVVQAVATLQEQFTAGTLSQAACVANVVTFLHLPEEMALKLFPTTKAVKRVDEGQQPGGGAPQLGAGQPQPQTFSAGHAESWQDEADRLLAKFRGT